MSFVGGILQQGMPAEATISVELTGTNRHLPAKLRAGDICEATDSSPAGARFRNLMKPTLTTAPPLGRALHWRLISHMALNHASLTSVDHFRELLRVYEFQSEHDERRAQAHRRLLEGVRKVEVGFSERLIRGAVARGVFTKITLHEDHFAGDGDAYLFATILDRFLGLYVTVNAYSELEVTFARTNQEYGFAPRWGEQLSPAGMTEGARA
jgi:type VI secretion system protein ImpG